MKLSIFNANRKIGNRISMGYIFVVAVAAITTLTCILFLRNNKEIDQEISEVQIPAMMLAKDFRLMVIESKKLTNSWIYLPNQQEKDKLKTLIEKDFPAIREKIDSLNILAGKSAIKEFSDDIFAGFEEIIKSEQQVTGYLANDETYSSDSLVDLAITTYEASVVPKVKALDETLSAMIVEKDQYLQDKNQEKEVSSSRLSILMLVSLVLILGVGISASIFSAKSITNPLLELKSIISALGKGEILEKGSSLNNRNDEIGEMSAAIDMMIKGLISKAEFADEIGKGNYEKEFSLLSDQDRMGFALIEMRNNLKKNAEEERKRTWATTGLAQIGEILRKTDISSEQLYNNILGFTVKYLNANQGGLFILNEDESGSVLELVACYAYEKRRYTQKTLTIGEGLVGQCFLEKDIIYITSIPSDYVNITSGIGAATPSCILIVPLKINELVLGVMEIASFKPLEAYEIEFTQKFGESIASTVSTVKVNEKTKHLLNESQIQSEQMRSQEEEMRQNMEELQATQEEVQRKESEYLKEIEGLKRKLMALA